MYMVTNHIALIISKVTCFIKAVAMAMWYEHSHKQILVMPDAILALLLRPLPFHNIIDTYLT